MKRAGGHGAELLRRTMEHAAVDLKRQTTEAIAARDPMRKPHRVTRTLVMREGQEAPRNLYQWFDRFNADHFGGKLQTPLLQIAPTSSPRAEGEYIARDLHGLQSVIRIRPSTYKLGDRFAVACLLHEMVHAYQSEVLRDLEPGYKGHGPKFCLEANRVGIPLGFPEVAPQGRGKKARAETWPILSNDPRAPVPAQDGAEGDDGDGDTETLAPAPPKLHPMTRAERDHVVTYLSKLAHSFMHDFTTSKTPDQEDRIAAKVCQFLSVQIEDGKHSP